MVNGLNLNIKFTGVRDFDSSCDINIFDLLNIDLVHGWLVDPQDLELVSIVGDMTYNQLTEKYQYNTKTNTTNDKSTLQKKDSFSEFGEAGSGLSSADLAIYIKMTQFLKETSSQLSYHGLYELHSKLQEGSLAVLFRNNHFCTILKHNSELYILITDEGYINEPVVWEKLSQINGDSDFLLDDFTAYKKQDDYTNFTEPNQGAPPIPSEFLTDEEYAKSDFAVAMQLQNMENQATPKKRAPKEAARREPKEGKDSKDGKEKSCLIQ
eukprot:gene17722-21132_t